MSTARKASPAPAATRRAPAPATGAVAVAKRAPAARAAKAAGKPASAKPASAKPASARAATATPAATAKKATTGTKTTGTKTTGTKTAGTKTAGAKAPATKIAAGGRAATPAPVGAQPAARRRTVAATATPVRSRRVVVELDVLSEGAAPSRRASTATVTGVSRRTTNPSTARARKAAGPTGGPVPTAPPATRASEPAAFPADLLERAEGAGEVCLDDAWTRWLDSHDGVDRQAELDADLARPLNAATRAELRLGAAGRWARSLSRRLTG
ncbi:MAG TPA: hypothetical protein VFP61_02365, partial [Acidimicrobiales bacterium]|nr:hypothetical protein [Acidimicrobiales bacterium]